MSKITKAKNIMLKGVRFRYYFYYVLLFISLLFYMLGTYTTKALIDAINKESFETMDFLEKAFFNVFGGYDLLTNNLWVFAIILVIFALLSGGTAAFRFVYRAKTSTQMGKQLQDALFYKVERLPYSQVKGMKNGDILQTCTRDEDVFRRFLTDHMYSIFYSVFIVIIAVIILFITNVEITLITMALMPIMFVYSFFLIKEVRRRYRATDDSEGEMTAKVEENLSAVRVVKAFNNEAYEINNFETYIDDYKKKFIHWRKMSAFFFSSSDIFIFGQILLTTVFGFYLCYQRYADPLHLAGISVGTMVIAFTYADTIVWPIRDLATILSNVARAYAAVERINILLDSPNEDIYTGEKPVIKGSIEFKHVSFAFPDEPDRNAIKDVSFSVKAGQTVAIMGKTGSGKSTLAYLLNRLYDYQSGEIDIDGMNIQKIEKAWLRKNIALILQEPFLFSKTIKDNLTIGKKDVTEDDIKKATKISQIHDSINKFQFGYDTPVGERGTTLSGGQKQRVAIARSLILNSPVLIFDDSLSAVDTETDYNIRQALKNRDTKSTTIIITHRIATAKDADLIIVLNNGKIEAMGKHDDLVNKEGLYSRIYKIQTKME